MAESAVPDVSLTAGSEVVYDIVCQPCSSDGRNAEAEVYCRDCHEHLCGQCIKHHKKFSSMKHHQLVDKDAMPGTQDDVQVRDVCTERCEEHKEEIIKFFCPDHKALACGVCVTLSHKRCDDMDYIQDVAAGLEDRQDYKEFTANQGGLAQKSKDTVTLALKSKQRASDCHAKVMGALDVYRDELVDSVDKNIQDLKDQAVQILTEDTERMDKLAALGNQSLTELQSAESDFERLLAKKHLCKMFVAMKRKEETFTKLQEKIDKMGGANAGVATYTFKPDEELQKTLDVHSGLGKLVVTSPARVAEPRNIQQINATHVADINVKSSDNSETCDISGMAVISHDNVVVVDYNNDTIKLIDTVKNSVISEFTPESAPSDVTVYNDTIAATLPHSRKIVFLKHDKGLVHVKDISVDGCCSRIDWYDDKLYVIFDKEKKLKVMTTTGVVLQSFTTNDMGDQLFDKPWNVTVSAVNKRIYVSDWEKDQLVVLDMAGKQTGVYKDSELGTPRELIVDNTGVMFLCDYCNETIHLLSPDNEKVKILLTSDDGLEDPECLCYCEDSRRLYVSMEESDTVKVYQIS